jgi:hypothetical protein
MVKLLLAAGADTDHADKFGYTPLAEAVFQKNENVIRLLVSNGANINHVFNDLGGTLLDAVKKRVGANHASAMDVSQTDSARAKSRQAALDWQRISALLSSLGAQQTAP